jgi:hypothetical protein
MSAIVADNLIDMNTGDADGTTLTTSILDNGTQGIQGTWSITGTAADLTITSSGSDRLDKVILRGDGTSYATNATHRRIAHNPADATTYIELTFPVAALYATSISGWVTLGPTDAGASGQPFDLISLFNVNGNYTVLQLWNGNSPTLGAYALNLHTNPGGVSTTTGDFAVTSGTRYWFSLQMNSEAATAEWYLYDTSGTQLQHATASTNTGGGKMSSVRIGNNQTGVSAGHTTYFEDIIIDYTKAATPLGPTGPAIYWVEKFDTGGGSNPPGSGAATHITAQVPGVAAGDVVVVIAKWEGGAGSSISCSDGTSSLTASSVSSTTGQANTSGDPYLAIFYLLSSVATGTVTYDVSIGASRTFRDMAVIVVTPPAGSGSIALDGTNTGNTAASGTSLTSNNHTTTGTRGMSFGGYAEFGASIQKPKVNSVLPDGFRQSASGNSAAWCVSYTAGFTGAATGTLSGSNRWNAQVISFTASVSTAIDWISPSATMSVLNGYRPVGIVMQPQARPYLETTPTKRQGSVDWVQASVDITWT